MALQDELKKGGEGLLGYFERYQKQADAERRARMEARSRRPTALGRMVALTIDFFLIVLMFGSVMTSSKESIAAVALLTQTAADPQATLGQAVALLNETGLLRSWIAVTLSQAVALALIVVPSLYFLQGTPGMLALGLRMRRKDRRAKPGLRHCVGFFFASCLMLFPFMQGYLGMLWRRDERAFQDVLSGTIILRKRELEKARTADLARELAEAEAASGGMAAE